MNAHALVEPSGRTVRLCHLYADQMNIYADRGNIAVLKQRLAWRGHQLVVTEVGHETTIDPSDFDFFYMGGGQDADQALVAADLASTKGAALRSAASDGAVQLYVCGGIQLAGHWYEAVNGERLPGVGVLDLETRAGQTRLIGDLVIDAELDGETRQVVGYENHAGRTHLGTGCRPLGSVVSGHGNNDQDQREGGVAEHVIGTYLHGPLLPKNPWLADKLLGWALAHHYPDEQVTLAALDDSLELAAHQAAVAGANTAR